MKERKEIIRNPIVEVDLERPFEPAQPPGRYPSYREFGTVEGMQFLDYWRAIRKRLWLVLGVVVLITTLTAIYMARRPNIYSARAVIQVDNEQINPDLVTSDRQRALLNSDPSYFNTQLQLLGSDSLLRRVIKDHNLDIHKEMQQARSDGSGSAWRAALRSLGLAPAEPKRSGETVVADTAIASSEEIADAKRLAPYVQALKTNIDIEPFRESRTTVKDTRLIGINFRHTSPEFAAFVVNAIAETFATQNQEQRTGTSTKTNDYLQGRIASLEADIQRDEAELLKLNQNAGILKTEGEQTIVIDRLSGLNKQLLEAENQRKNAEANYLAVSNSPERIRALAEAEIARFTTEQESNIRALRADTQKKIGDLRVARVAKQELFEDGAPELRQIDEQIKSYQATIDEAVSRSQRELDAFRQQATRNLVENLRTKYLQAKQQEDKIRADFDKQYAEAQSQDQSALNIKLLQQNIETNKGFLDNLRKQVSGNDIAAQGTDNNIRVTEIAIPPDAPVAPRRLATVAAALFLSTLFAMGLALFLEYLDDTIRTTEEVEKYLMLPALAAIPSLDSLPRRRLLLVGAQEPDDGAAQSPLLISADPRSSLAEAYRHLRTSILLSTAGHPPKVLLITSSLPSEGKTTTATNTAISLAQTGAKVLIIDADMRRPRLHNVFNTNNRAGLSTVLASELNGDDVDAAIMHDEKTNLHVMTSGPIPPNPAELIGSEQMEALLRLLQARFTHVVIDSPPIASFTDGVLLASMVDGVILVVHAGKSSRQVVRRSRQLLQEIGARVFGVVLNNVDLNTKDNYYYYQSYYHRSSYFSGDEKE